MHMFVFIILCMCVYVCVYECIGMYRYVKIVCVFYEIKQRKHIITNTKEKRRHFQRKYSSIILY